MARENAQPFARSRHLIGMSEDAVGMIRCLPINAADAETPGQESCR
jgi:hypothetical protein